MRAPVWILALSLLAASIAAPAAPIPGPDSTPAESASRTATCADGAMDLLGTGTPCVRWARSGARGHPVVGPDGASLHVAGGNFTQAVNMTTGEVRWTSQTIPGFDGATDLVVSSSGDRLFVAGLLRDCDGICISHQSYPTVAALDGDDGTVLWNRTDDVRGRGGAIAVVPGGDRVVMTRTVLGGGFKTAAYDAATGTEIWNATYASEGAARDVVADPSGSKVYVTGGAGDDFDQATLAYDASTGEERWRFVDAGRGRALAMAPDGDRLFVTGTGSSPASGLDYVTRALDTATGQPLWMRYHDGPASGNDHPWALAAGPDGGGVYVTGVVIASSEATGGCPPLVSRGCEWDYGTVAYDAATGLELWSRAYDGPAETETGETPEDPGYFSHDLAWSLVASPTGDHVYVTGQSVGEETGFDFATVGYRAGTGLQAWVARHDGGGSDRDRAFSLAVDPDGETLVVTGKATGPNGSTDSRGIAYELP